MVLMMFNNVKHVFFGVFWGWFCWVLTWFILVPGGKWFLFPPFSGLIVPSIFFSILKYPLCRHVLLFLSISIYIYTYLYCFWFSSFVGCSYDLIVLFGAQHILFQELHRMLRLLSQHLRVFLSGCSDAHQPVMHWLFSLEELSLPFASHALFPITCLFRTVGLDNRLILFSTFSSSLGSDGFLQRTRSSSETASVSRCRPMPQIDAVSMAPKKSEKGYTGPEDEQQGKDTKKEASRISRGQVEETSAEMSVRFLINERFNRKIPYHPEMKASTLFSFLERYLKSEGVYAWRNKPGIGLECEGPWLIFGGRALLPDARTCWVGNPPTTGESTKWCFQDSQVAL